MTINRLFVYGSLALNQKNEQVLSSIGGSWEKASVNGQLVESGWGSKLGHPGLILDKSGDVVKGFMFSSPKLSNHWDVLDKFEGKDYKRILTVVDTSDSGRLEAYVYVLNQSG